MKKSLIIIMAIVICLLLPLSAFAAESGKMGDNVTWSYSGGVLTVTGSGDMWELANSEHEPLPYSVTESVKKIVIGEGITRIGDSCFHATTAEEVQLPSTLKSIGEGAFINSTKLQSINWPEGLEQIEYRAFCYTPMLKSVVFPDSLKIIGRGAFEDGGLISIKFGSGLQSIGANAFSGLNYMDNATITIPGSCEAIGYEAFANSSIDSVVMEEGVEYIYERAFFNCGLQTITVPRSVTTIEEDIVGSNPKTIYYGGSAPEWVIMNNAGLDTDLKMLKAGRVICADPKQWIDGYCGAEGDNVTWTVHGNGALILAGSGRMQDYSVENPAPYGKRFDYLEFRDGITHIGAYAFYDCDNFMDFKGNAKNSIYLTPSVKSLGAYAYAQCDGTTGPVTLPAVEYGDHCFYYCDFTEVTVPEGVTELGSYVLASCTNMTEINLPSTLQKIGEEAFHFCRMLEEIIIPEGVTHIGDYAFNRCNRLKNIELPAQLDYLGSAAFMECGWLTEINISKGVTVLDETFYGCSQLTTVYLPDTVTEIKEKVFEQCSRLQTIYYEGSENEWLSLPIASNGNNMLNREGIVVYGRENTGPVKPPVVEKPPVETGKPIVRKTINLTLGSAIAKVDGVAQTMDVVPEVKQTVNGGGVVFLPFRFVAEILGMEVSWVPANRMVDMRGNGKQVRVFLYQEVALVDNNSMLIGVGVAPYATNGRTMVPLRFIAEAIGCEVIYDPVTKGITIK